MQHPGLRHIEEQSDFASELNNDCQELAVKFWS